MVTNHPPEGSKEQAAAPAAPRSLLGHVLLWAFGLAAAGALVIGLLVAVALAMAYPQLPDISDLADYRPKLSMRVYSVEGIQIGEFGEERRNLTPFKDIPKVMKDAVLAIEDGVAYMRNAPDDYFDLIIIDSTDPIGPGVGLFTEAFYSQAKRALAPRGILTAQTESPLAEAEGMARIYKVLHSVFPQVGAFFGTVPTYPGALWSWAYCTKTAEQAGGPHPLNTFNMAAAHALTPQLRYYNAAVHQAVFALPNFVQALVQPTLAV
jgi:hypothetical protein